MAVAIMLQKNPRSQTLTDSSTGANNPTGSIKFSGFDANTAYEFIFMASRSTNENRPTLYTLVGDETKTTIVNPSNGGTRTGNIAGVYSNGAGEISLTVENAPENSSAFAYLGGLQIIPEPGAAAALIGFAALGVVMLRRRN